MTCDEIGASQQFVRSFTKMYPELARRAPIYAQLRNCIDLAVAAAFIQKHDLYGQADWNLEVFGDESVYPIEVYNPPTQVATAVNSMWKGNRLMTPVGGGVQMRPGDAVINGNLLSDSDGEVVRARDAIDISSLAADQWWWD